MGAEAIAEWRWSNPRMRLDLSGANLRDADLTEADLRGANLKRGNLSRAHLTAARLSGADLWWANLRWAGLSRAHLSGAGLRGADLTGVNLWRADLSGADLGDVDLSEAQLGHTSLIAVNLSNARGLTAAKHDFPSSVSVDTLIASVRGPGGQLTPQLRVFFRGAGVPGELLEALPGILAEVKYHTCFIAYGQPDLELARKLYEALNARGVSSWLYDMDATPGERTWGEILTKQREAEKTVVLCSAAALVRDGVLKEIEEQIDQDPDKMVPISLDDLWKEPGFRVMRASRDLKPYLLHRNYADFANLAYEEALERLLRALRRETERRHR